jgi:hypothetical protein
MFAFFYKTARISWLFLANFCYLNVIATFIFKLAKILLVIGLFEKFSNRKNSGFCRLNLIEGTCESFAYSSVKFNFKNRQKIPTLP